MSTQGHNLNNFGSTPIHNVTYYVSRSSVQWFWRRRFFKVFTIYGHGGHVGHVTQLIYINFHSFSPSSFQMNFGSACNTFSIFQHCSALNIRVIITDNNLLDHIQTLRQLKQISWDKIRREIIPPYIKQKQNIVSES